MLWSWGANSYGQLGLGTVSEQEETPRPVTTGVECHQIVGGGGHTVMIDSGGGLHVTGWNNVGQLGLGHTDQVLEFTPLELSETVTQVSCGWDFTLVLTESGQVYSCGNNSFGQLGRLLL